MRAIRFQRSQRRGRWDLSKVLSDSLEDLKEKQLVNPEIVSEKPVRVEYSLTELGASLEPVIYAMRDWGNEHLKEADSKETSTV